MAHPTDTLGPCRRSRQAPTVEAAGDTSVSPPSRETPTAPADLSARAALCPRGGACTFDCSIASPATAGAARAAYRRLVAADAADRRYGMAAAGRCHAHRNGLRTAGLDTRHVGVGMTILPRRRHSKVIASSRLDTRPARTPVNASPPPSRAAAHDSGPPWVASDNLAGFSGAQEVPNDTERTARARGVSPGEPGESHAARVTNRTQTGRPRCGRESSQGAARRSAILSKIHIRRNV